MTATALPPPCVRYLLRVTVLGKGMTPDSKRDFPIWVRNYEKLHEATTPIKARMRVPGAIRTRVCVRTYIWMRDGKDFNGNAWPGHRGSCCLLHFA